MSMPHPSTPKPLLVACLCADWCGTCREYRPLFDQLTTRFVDVHFVWIDIEDDSDLIDPLEVENFPTILIASPQQTLFFGTVLPHIQALQRLIEVQRGSSTTALPKADEILGLAHRLWQRAQVA